MPKEQGRCPDNRCQSANSGDFFYAMLQAALDATWTVVTGGDANWQHNSFCVVGDA
ncbi:MAG: hypothetical protein ACYTAO_06520 [Planctomycetota bacterium]|jgi:hypothetical protein